MGRFRRELILQHDLDNRVVTFPDKKQWKLTKKLSAKAWEGSTPSERAEWKEWRPDEEHAVYECKQVRGPQVGTEAIMKIRVEIPHYLPPSENPEERAREACGMRFNFATTQEIETLQKLTAAGCSVTPRLLGVKTDVQDTLVSASRTKTPLEAEPVHEIDWWMPGGYIVYILMAKLQAEPLSMYKYWYLFTKQDRDDIRAAFRKSYIELRKFGMVNMDSKLENLMWDKNTQKCYIIDLEDTLPESQPDDPEFWTDSEYFFWNLARHWEEPNW